MKAESAEFGAQAEAWGHLLERDSYCVFQEVCF